MESPCEKPGQSKNEESLTQITYYTILSKSTIEIT